MSDDAPETRKLTVDMSDLEVAFDDSSGEASSFLDLETGRVVAITDEIRGELERVYEEADSPDGITPDAFEEALRRRDLPGWMKEAIREADQVEDGFGIRYIRIPHDESRDAYGDMDAFIDTVRDGRLQRILAHAIQGSGAFRRFKDALDDDDQERERWFRFRDARLRERILAWLRDEGIDPALE